jgi:hypothetical protein
VIEEETMDEAATDTPKQDACSSRNRGTDSREGARETQGRVLENARQLHFKEGGLRHLPGLFSLPELHEMHGSREWLCFVPKQGVSLLHPFSSFLLKEVQKCIFQVN